MDWEKINDFRKRAGSNLHGDFFWLTKTYSPTAGVCPARLVREFAAEFHANLETPGKLPPHLRILANEAPENNRLKQWLLHQWEIQGLDIPAHIIQDVNFAKRCLLREIFSPAKTGQPLLVIILGSLLDVQEIIGDDLWYQVMTYTESLLTSYIGLETIPQAADTFSGYYLDASTESGFSLQLKRTIPIR